MRGAAEGRAQRSSAPPPWLIPPEQYILLPHKAGMMLMEYDRDVRALPISGTQSPGKTYVFGAVSLFLLKRTT